MAGDGVSLVNNAPVGMQPHPAPAQPKPNAASPPPPHAPHPPRKSARGNLMHNLQQAELEKHMALAKMYAKDVTKHDPARQSIYENAINEGLADLRKSWATGARRTKHDETKLIKSIIETLSDSLESDDLQKAIEASLETDKVSDSDFIEITLANTEVPAGPRLSEYSRKIRKALENTIPSSREQRLNLINWAAENLKLAYELVTSYEKEGKIYGYQATRFLYPIAERLNGLNRALTRPQREPLARAILGELLKKEKDEIEYSSRL